MSYIVDTCDGEFEYPFDNKDEAIAFAIAYIFEQFDMEEYPKIINELYDNKNNFTMKLINKIASAEFCGSVSDLLFIRKQNSSFIEMKFDKDLIENAILKMRKPEDEVFMDEEPICSVINDYLYINDCHKIKLENEEQKDFARELSEKSFLFYKQKHKSNKNI